MRTKLIYILSSLLLLSIWSCIGGEVDTTPPTLKERAYTPEPQEAEICSSIEPKVFLLTGGDQLGFDILFEDNEQLSQYKVDIHNNFDCHGHGGGVAPKVVVPNVPNQTIDWAVLDIQSLSGKSQTVVKSYDVPNNVTAGNYHFHIQVIDESGNDTPFKNFYSLKIKNPLDSIAPEISVQEPTTALTVKRGDKVRFVGNVSDNRSLSNGGNGVLYLAYTDLSSGNTFTSNAVFIFDEQVDTSFDFDFEYSIPQTLVSGKYRFSLGANDGVRNVAAFQFFDVELVD